MEPAEIVTRAKEVAGGLRNASRRAFRDPVSAVLTALAAGFVFGLALRLFERPPREAAEKQAAD